ncbi:DNA-binding MarR family transcriptional regulator [Streptomyces sp. V3I8]|jgi:DNA-binding MarR family transcriptional regulator|uniref:MarR family winged helix-turn-helix transcriptional regulator n=1 Tax=Streptomyces sp. V3I8 TaxID=3042279 RepID=UPI002786E172|nr:MarR family transcriptional regulator [Streptomyces sp. V3I8]MDQ1040928.1 DNA-binding MarR family transcriptional regulator [Streptomyces sp. V3I8]
MDREQAPAPVPDTFAAQVLDAVESLVALWSAAAEDGTPRMSTRQLLALQTVHRLPELNLTAFAEHLGVALPTASRLCDRLEAVGLLQRTVQPHNRREVQLLVTSRGRRLLADVTERRTLRLSGVFDAMAQSERDSLRHGLHAFHRARALARPQPPANG